jgi:hypothetical protein
VHWTPTTILRADQAFKTATDTVRVKTDVGYGYLKALGNHGGPHYLAADLVGTQLAAWLGLPTFDWAIVNVTLDDEIIFLSGSHATPGPAFVTREHSGTTWGGKPSELNSLINPDDIGKLVLFDTWTRNCDRHPPDLHDKKVNLNNVFLSNENLQDGQWRVMAMDHTHCFNCGRDLNAQLAHINLIKDERLYGLFPQFSPLIRKFPGGIRDGLVRLQSLDRGLLESIVAGIPKAWQVDSPGRIALVTLLFDRAQFVTETFATILNAAIEQPN